MTIDIKLPKSWYSCTKTQLTYILTMVSLGYSTAQLKTLLLLKEGGIKVLATKPTTALIQIKDEAGHKHILEIENSKVAAMTAELEWLEEPPTYPLDINGIAGLKTRYNPRLDNLPFGQWLAINNHWQGYLETQNHGHLHEIAQIILRQKRIKPMHRTQGSNELSIAGTAVFYYILSVQNHIQQLYPTLYSQAPSGSESQPLAKPHNKLREAVDTQIRALTKGDITKETEILNSDTHRALTELEALAREYRELKAKQ